MKMEATVRFSVTANTLAEASQEADNWLRLIDPNGWEIVEIDGEGIELQSGMIVGWRWHVVARKS